MRRRRGHRRVRRDQWRSESARRRAFRRSPRRNFPPPLIRCRRGPFWVTRIEEDHPGTAWPNPGPTWPNATSTRHVETCGAHFPRLMSLADAFEQPAAAAISESATVLSCGGMSSGTSRVVDHIGIGGPIPRVLACERRWPRRVCRGLNPDQSRDLVT